MDGKRKMAPVARFVVSEVKAALFESGERYNVYLPSGKRYNVYLPHSAMYGMLDNLGEEEWEQAFLALGAEGIALSYEPGEDEFVAKHA